MHKRHSLNVFGVGCILVSLCSCAAEFEDDTDDTEEIGVVEQAAVGAYCNAYKHINKDTLLFRFDWPRDYNDLHRKPNYGDQFSSIECFGGILNVYEHSTWGGKYITLNNQYIPDLAVYGMGDKISSVRWADQTTDGSCEIWEDKYFNGTNRTLTRGYDWNDLHRQKMETRVIPYPPYTTDVSWGDQISSVRCYGTSITLCTDDRWGGNCRTFSGEWGDLHAEGYGDNISSIKWP